jgi:S1-C subfamily serine protease
VNPEPNQSSQRNPMARPFSVFDSRSSSGDRLMLKAEIFLAMVCLTTAGCVGPNATSEVRRASFTAYTSAKVGDVPIREYILIRYAALVSGREVSVTSSLSEHPSVEGFFTKLGSAVPVDQRGYFLTAAHCVGAESVQIAYINASAMCVEEARIIWRGDTGEHPVDLALVRIASPLDCVFSWAVDFAVEDEVLGAGPSSTDLPGETPAKFEVDCFAGKIVKLSSAEGALNPYVRISHSAPIHAGDSGGPLINRHGELLGINARGWLWNGRYVQLPFVARGYAFRPIVGALQRIIDDDAAGEFRANPADRVREPTSGVGPAGPHL